jgi:hypothetical protein
MKYRLCYVSDAVVWPTTGGFHAEANWPFHELAGELESCAELVVVGRTLDEPPPAAAQFVPAASGTTRIRAVGYHVARRGPMGYAGALRAATRLLRREYGLADVLYLKPSIAAFVGQRFVTPRHLVVTHLMGNPAETAPVAALARPIVRRATRSLFRGATLPVSVSAALAAEIDPACRGCLVVNESRLRPSHVVPPGARRPYALGYVGRLAPEKGADLLPDILERFADARLLILGAGSTQSALMTAFDRKGLRDRVDLRAPVPWGEELFARLDAIDVLLMPSHSEGCGLAAIEVLARGGKVAAARVGGLAENLDGLGRARLVPTHSIDAWVEAIDELHASEEAQPDVRRFLFDENMKTLASEIERRFRRSRAA